jgi:SsrA-binding protein
MKIMASNRRASFDYSIEKTYLAGIVLKGHEVKAIRSADVHLKGAYVVFTEGEAFSIGLHIKAYKNAIIPDYDPEVRRKLLLNKKEIKKIVQAQEEPGTAIIITKVIAHDNNLIKLEIAIAKGKKTYEKKDCKKRKDIDREIRKSFKI